MHSLFACTTLHSITLYIINIYKTFGGSQPQGSAGKNNKAQHKRKGTRSRRTTNPAKLLNKHLYSAGMRTQNTHHDHQICPAVMGERITSTGWKLMLLRRLRLLRSRPAIGSAIADLLLLRPPPRIPHGACVGILCSSGCNVCESCLCVLCRPPKHTHPWCGTTC